jgi:hypothetical protein
MAAAAAATPAVAAGSGQQGACTHIFRHPAFERLLRLRQLRLRQLLPQHQQLWQQQQQPLVGSACSTPAGWRQQLHHLQQQQQQQGQ